MEGFYDDEKEHASQYAIRENLDNFYFYIIIEVFLQISKVYASNNATMQV